MAKIRLPLRIQKFLELMIIRVKKDRNVLAVWLTGSATTSSLTRYSDVDAWICCKEGNSKIYEKLIHRLTTGFKTISRYSLGHAPLFMGGQVHWIKFNDWPDSIYLDLHITNKEFLSNPNFRQIQYMVTSLPRNAILYDPKSILKKVKYPPLKNIERNKEINVLINEFFFYLIRTLKYKKLENKLLFYKCFLRLYEILVGSWKLLDIDRLDFEPKWSKNFIGKKRECRLKYLINKVRFSVDNLNILIKEFEHVAKNKAGENGKCLFRKIKLTFNNFQGNY